MKAKVKILAIHTTADAMLLDHISRVLKLAFGHDVEEGKWPKTMPCTSMTITIISLQSTHLSP